MQWFANLRLRSKLLVSFASVVLMTAVLGVFAISRVSVVNDQSTVMAEHWLISQRAASDINANMGDYRVAELQFAGAAASERGQFEPVFAAKQAAINKLMADYAAHLVDPQDKTLWDAFKADWAAYLAEHDKWMAAIKAGRSDEAHALAIGSTQRIYDHMGDSIDKVVKFNVDGGTAASDEGDRIYGNARMAIIVAIVLVGSACMALAWMVSGQISVPVEEAAGVLQAVAEGDLTRTVLANRNDEIGDMQKALASMMNSLSDMVHQVRTGADSVATASSEIAQGNTDLSARTENQASSLQETAASVEEMAGTVRTNADNAHQANQLASAASDVAARGGDVVGQVVDTMTGIQSSSQKISDIIGVIDGIAFQTNILALNAAVEAARAGEQGRGFAVVAGEVRSLAQRSAQAAREIKTLINDSVEKVNAGSQLVSAAGDTMSDVVNQVRKVTDLVGEIAHASTEQSQGIGQINQAVSQLDQTTQQNAALVEQSMAAAESLKAQARKLAEAVAVFKLRSSGGYSAGVTSTFAALSPQPRTAPSSSSTSSASSATKAVAKPAAPRHAAASRPATASAAPSAPPLPSPEPAKAAAHNDQDWETF
ncbi:MAG: methyl-accepting chemotaxis protein [Aquabacterium sp.]